MNRTLLRMKFLAAVLFCVLAPLSQAAETAAGTAQTVISPASSILQVMAGLVIVLLLLGGAAWTLKRMGNFRQQVPGAMRVLGAVAVGQRERVVLIEIAHTWLFVGVAPGSVSALHSMPKGTGTVLPVAAPQMEQNFATWLKRFTEGGRDAS
jgi:flagellar protein FliO/FliZ